MLNIDEYIKSGILEEYAMGLLSEDQAREVFRMAQIHPLVKHEIDRIEATLFKLSSSYGIPPSPGLGSLIQAKVISQGVQTSDPVFITKHKAFVYAPTAIMILVVSLILSLYVKVRRDLTENMKSTAYVIEQLQIQNAELIRQLKHTNNFSVTRTRLVSTGADNQYAWVYADQKELLVCTSYLPDPPEDQQYQVWSIVGEDLYDSGLIPIGSTGTMSYLVRYPGTDSYAITSEPKGGSKRPTLDNMVVSGAVVNTKFQSH